MYRDGLGVIQDYVIAHMWFNLAATKNNLNAAANGFFRDSLEEKMTPQQLAEAQKLARECLAKKYKGC